MKVVILGGVAAGMSAASKLRREVKDAQIVVIEKGVDVSYGACGLPYYIGGENENADLMRIRKAEVFIEKQNIDVRLLSEAVSVDPSSKTVKVLNLVSMEEYEESYDKLVVATGASPIIPNLPGVGLKNIFTLKSIQDGEKIKKTLNSDSIKNVVIVGSGFIGLEMAEACAVLGKKVRIIEMLSRVMNPFEPEITELISKTLVDHGVVLNTDEKVEEFTGEEYVKGIRTNKGSYEADLVLLSVGVSPNTTFLRNVGFDFMRNGAIIVNGKMETCVADIYAGGDCAGVHHKILKKDVYLPLGTNANKQGKIIGENLAGKDKEFPGALGTSVLRVIDIEAGKTGISEEEAKNNGIAYGTTIVEVNNHAPYYPNPKPIRIKLVYDPETRRVLGACAAGGSGTALRINTFAAIIDAGMTLDQVSNLDLCYAPPFSQVWDAIHVAVNSVK